ncbi:MAG TPA: flagellar basal body rod protein FlgB [Rudaea sp.]|nr:flagellar basal body rod protein FlgB [Rudaea sp.]
MDTSNNLFGIHAAALGLREARLDVLASNLANADTPNYQARDIDFAQALTDATNAANVTKQSTDDGKTSVTISTQPDPTAAALKYRIPLQPSLDGNTVDSDYEHAAFARAALEYKASLQFITSRAHTLMTAITGS